MNPSKSSKHPVAEWVGENLPLLVFIVWAAGAGVLIGLMAKERGQVPEFWAETSTRLSQVQQQFGSDAGQAEFALRLEALKKVFTPFAVESIQHHFGYALACWTIGVTAIFPVSLLSLGPKRRLPVLLNNPAPDWRPPANVVMPSLPTKWTSPKDALDHLPKYQRTWRNWLCELSLVSLLTLMMVGPALIKAPDGSFARQHPMQTISLAFVMMMGMVGMMHLGEKLSKLRITVKNSRISWSDKRFAKLAEIRVVAWLEGNRCGLMRIYRDRGFPSPLIPVPVEQKESMVALFYEKAIPQGTQPLVPGMRKSASEVVALMLPAFLGIFLSIIVMFLAASVAAFGYGATSVPRAEVMKSFRQVANQLTTSNEASLQKGKAFEKRFEETKEHFLQTVRGMDDSNWMPLWGLVVGVTAMSWCLALSAPRLRKSARHADTEPPITLFSTPNGKVE